MYFYFYFILYEKCVFFKCDLNFSYVGFANNKNEKGEIITVYKYHTVAFYNFPITAP